MVGCGKATNSANSIKRKNQSKITKSKILVRSKNHDFPPKSKTKKTRTSFFTLKARLTFTQLRQAFVETLILHHFDPESYIQIKIDASSYTISSILS